MAWQQWLRRPDCVQRPHEITSGRLCRLPRSFDASMFTACRAVSAPPNRVWSYSVRILFITPFRAIELGSRYLIVTYWVSPKPTPRLLIVAVYTINTRDICINFFWCLHTFYTSFFPPIVDELRWPWGQEGSPISFRFRPVLLISLLKIIEIA